MTDHLVSGLSVDRLSVGLPPVVGSHLIIAVRWCGDYFLSLQAQESVKL